MNPIVLGALIGAIPALLAGALATWAAVRSGRVSLEQTELTLRAEHERWLREKRIELYVEMLRFVHDGTGRQGALIRKGKVTEEQKWEVLETMSTYGGEVLHDLAARAIAIASGEVNEAFTDAADAVNAVWAAILALIKAANEDAIRAKKGPGDVVLTSEISRLEGLAGKAESGLGGAVRRDLAVTSESVRRRQ